MDIEGVAVAAQDGVVELQAEAGGVPLYVRLPEGRFHAEAIGDALAVLALVPAMRAGTPLRLPPDLAVSAKIARELPGIQRVFRNWNPRLHAVELDAATRVPSGPGRGIGLYYAGGVDSSYSLLAHRDEIDTLVAIFGFDFTMSDEDMQASRERNGAFARRLGLDFVPVESNHSQFLSRHGVSRTFAYSASLAGIALLMGLERCYVATSHSPAYIRPGGAHPVLDPRFSSEATAIVHDDASLSRLEKTRALAAHPDYLDNLRVCWEYPNVNCGQCSKCVRTMVALRLLGVEGPFPPLADLRQVARMAAGAEHDYVIELALEAYRSGDDALHRALRQGLRRQDFKEALRYIAYAVTGRRVRNPLHRTPGESHLIKHDLRPDLDLH